MITYPYTAPGVLTALHALGKTANEVAANLAAFGFRGTRADCDDCPLVHYLVACLPTCHTIRVSDTGAYFFKGFGVDSLDLNVEHTEATKAFVHRFDNAAFADFPELERSVLIEGNADA